MYNFTKPRSGKNKNRYYPTLIIDNGVIEYSFVKNRSKTKEELKNDIIMKASRVLKPVSTIVSVYVDLKDVEYIEYNKDSNSVFLAGRFSVSYKNEYLKNELTKEHKDNLYCIVFDYDFVDVNKFIEIASQNVSIKEMKEVAIPISL